MKIGIALHGGRGVTAPGSSEDHQFVTLELLDGLLALLVGFALLLLLGATWLIWLCATP